MGTRPTPIVVCGEMAPHAPAALAAGAVDVVGELDARPASPQYVTALRRHLRVASRVRVITHPRNRLRARGLAPTPGRPPGSRPDRRRTPRCPVRHPGHRHRCLDRRPAGPRDDPGRPARRPDRAGAGHPAHGRRLRRGAGALAGRLSPMPVVMAEHGRRLAPGVVHVAPAGINTLLRPGLRIELRTPPEGQFHVPGVDAAFISAAATCGAHAIGVLLTGMGRDGAVGLRTMRDGRADDRAGRADQRGVGHARRRAGARRGRSRAAAARHRRGHRQRGAQWPRRGAAPPAGTSSVGSSAMTAQLRTPTSRWSATTSPDRRAGLRREPPGRARRRRRGPAARLRSGQRHGYLEALHGAAARWSASGCSTA